MEERLRRDYDRSAQEYDDFVRSDTTSTHLLSTAMVTAFAGMVTALDAGAEVVDAGCGPGQWTGLLAELGVRARGVDLSPEMVAIARRHHPDLRFEVGSLVELDVPDGSLGGVLAHFSLIHVPPAALPRALDGFARALRPDAPLLVGVQLTDADPDGTGWVAHDHTVSPSYRWTLDALSALLQDHGFRELARLRIEPVLAGKPPAGYLQLRREGGSQTPAV